MFNFSFLPSEEQGNPSAEELLGSILQDLLIFRYLM